MAPLHSSQPFRCKVTYANFAAVSAHLDSLSKFQRTPTLILIGCFTQIASLATLTAARNGAGRNISDAFCHYEELD